MFVTDRRREFALGRIRLIRRGTEASAQFQKILEPVPESDLLIQFWRTCQRSD
jgi:hypothetical protein